MLQVNNILVAVDLADSSKPALQAGYDLADRMKARLHLMYVQVEHPDPFSAATYPADHAERICTLMEQAVQDVEIGRPHGAGPEIEYAVEPALAVAPALVAYARRNAVDVMVTGTHGRRGVRHLMLGSVAEEVVRTADCPVLTVRPGDEEGTPLPGPGRDILVPVDFSDHSLEAIRYARELASLFRCGICMAHVVEEKLHPAFYNAGAFSIYDLQPDVEARALDHMRAEFEAVPGPDVPVRYEVTSGHAATELAQMTRSLPIGLVVMATHGLTGLAHLFLGSVAEHVVRISAAPTFCVKSHGRDLYGESSRKEKASETG